MMSPSLYSVRLMRWSVESTNPLYRFRPSLLTTVRKVNDIRRWRLRLPSPTTSVLRGAIPCCQTERASPVRDTQDPRCNSAGRLSFQ